MSTLRRLCVRAWGPVSAGPSGKVVLGEKELAWHDCVTREYSAQTTSCKAASLESSFTLEPHSARLGDEKAMIVKVRKEIIFLSARRLTGASPRAT